MTEINGSSVLTRQFAVKRLNEMERTPRMFAKTCEGFESQISILLEISGARDARPFLEFSQKHAGPNIARDLDDEWARLVVAHARGQVLALQMMRCEPVTFEAVATLSPEAPAPIGYTPHPSQASVVFEVPGEPSKERCREVFAHLRSPRGADFRGFSAASKRLAKDFPDLKWIRFVELATADD